MNAPNPYAPPQAAVADIAAPGIGMAGRGTRLLATIVDGFIFSVLFYGPILASGAFRQLVSMQTSPTSTSVVAMFASSAPYWGIGLLVWAVITIVLVQRNGQTIAKKLFGIKVVRADGSRASLGRIFWLRNIVNTLLSLIPLLGMLYGVLDSLWIFGAERRCLHDKIADTIVVNA